MSYERVFGRPRRRQTRPGDLSVRRHPNATALGAEPPTLDAVLHRDNLMAAFCEARDRGETGAGPDGLTCFDISAQLFGRIARRLPYAVRCGGYFPAAARVVGIPKASGGRRRIEIANIVDRVIAVALNRALQPTWEQVFLDWSYGSRPRRGTWDLLADLMTRMEAERRYVIAQDDVRGAFDHVRLDDVVADHRLYLEDMELIDFIALVLRAGRDDRRVGIPQGCPYSPAAMNLRLHHVHDLPHAAESGAPPAYRYIDNVVYPCADVSEGASILEQASQRLGRAGLALKGADSPPVDLRRCGRVQLLGFALSLKDGRPHLDLGVGGRHSLVEKLAAAQERANPSRRAVSAVLGWIDAHGPALGGFRESDLVGWVLRTAARYGFREGLSADRIMDAADAAYWRWDGLLQRTRSASGRTSGGILLPGPSGPSV